MTEKSANTTIQRTITVPASRERAFQIFTDHIGTWWPRENTFARILGKESQLDTVVIEPYAGGHWFERHHDGAVLEWGQVLAYEAPGRLILTWQITPDGLPESDPSKASEVELRFISEGSATTRVELEHRAFDQHGEDGAAMWHAAMDSSEGWDKFLDRYHAAIS